MGKSHTLEQQVFIINTDNKVKAVLKMLANEQSLDILD